MPSTYWPFIEQRHDERCKVLQRIRQVNNDENYQKALAAVKERIREQEASTKRESLIALIRQWYVEFRKVHGKFPDIPDEELGGSDDIFIEKTQEELDKIAEEERLKEEKKKEKEKQKDQPKITPTIAAKKQTKKQERTMPEWERIESKFLQPLHESCELYNRIIKEPRYIPLIDFIGEVGYISSTLRDLDKEPQITAGEIRRMIVEYAIIPLGSQEIHEKSPLIKSLLLVGPESSGKKTLVHIICTETGANLIDLTATNIVGKYPGRDGLKMLMHLIFKVAKLIQPSVIFVGDCEQMFLRRVPKGDTTEPTRLKKILPKLVKKMITPEERIMLIGTTSKPQLSRSKNLYTLYDKVIMVPRPDYGSRRLIWEHFVTHTIGRGFLKKMNIDFSSMSILSNGYTSGAIINTIKAVLTESRMGRAKEKPITSEEFIPHLSRKTPVYSKEEEVLKNWYLGTPLMKKRTEALTIMQEERDKLLEEAIKAENDKMKNKRKRR